MEVGIRRTGNATVGIVAVMRPAALLLAELLLTGCKAVPQIAGVVTGGTIGIASGSPALGFAAGIATDAAASAALRRIVVVRQGAEQDAVAEAAGSLTLGEKASWRIDHTIPIGNEHGELEVVRVIDTSLASCKEIVFSVDDESSKNVRRNRFVTSICKQSDRWKWAGAEPAVERWGFLQ